MISTDLAQRLRDAGLAWSPLPGDRFVVTSPGMESEVFYLADMTVEVHHFATGPVVGFNGTTEWALDSVELQDTLWLPREDQLRATLAEAFVRLEPVHGGYAVTVMVGGQEHREIDLDAERAYARAVLHWLTSRG